MEARDLSAGDARIRFVERGLSTGPTLVVLHDCLASHETFLPAGEHLADAFRVVSPDLPGFGASEKPDPRRYSYGYDAFADSVADLIAALDVGRVHVCGHAMGGGVALALAARHPSLVHKLILVDALVYPVHEHGLDRVASMPLLGALMWQQVMGRALFGKYMANSTYAGGKAPAPPRLHAYYASFNTPAARRAALATVRMKADTRTLVARLSRVTAESLVVWGRHDSVAPVEHGRLLARALKARLEVLECGRCPPDEEPAAFAGVVKTFLSPRPPSRSPSSRRLPHVP